MFFFDDAEEAIVLSSHWMFIKVLLYFVLKELNALHF